MEGLLQDIRYGIRILFRSPGFSAVAILALALGIGANTAMFSMVNAVMLRPLQFPKPKQLVEVFHSYAKFNLPHATVSPAALKYYLENKQAFDSMGAFTGFRAPENLTGAGEPQRVRSVMVTGQFFQTLAVPTEMGRAIAPEDDKPGSRVAVVSNGLWKRLYAGDPNIVGRTITLDGANYTVIGVMPATFDFPSEAQIWVPLALTDQQWSNDGVEYLNVIARLKPGLRPEQAGTETQRLTAGLTSQAPELASVGWKAVAEPLSKTVQGDMRPALLVLLGAVGCVLMIACANVANLLLARATARQKEIAIRSAMGASRLRLARQLLTESVLLSLLGGALGILLGWQGIRAALSIIPVQLPSFIHVTVDGTVLVFTFVLAVTTGLLFGIVPAMHTSSAAISDTLKAGGRGASSAHRNQFRNGLIVAEFAIALVLLIGAGLLIRSFSRIQQANYGFDSSRLLTFDISLPKQKYATEPQVSAFYQQLTARLASLPGAVSVGASTGLPLSGGWTSTYEIQGKQIQPRPHAFMAIATPGFIETVRIPVLRGRTFTPSDGANDPLVVMIDEVTARAFFRDQDPVGQHIIFGRDPKTNQPRTREIIGVVGAVRHLSALKEDTKGQVYLPFLQMASPQMSLAVRTLADPLEMTPAVRRAVADIDPQAAIFNVRTMEDLLGRFVAQPRFNMLLLGTFAGLALVLASVGIYGVISYSVAQRMHEIGVRMALGATPAAVLRLVLSQGMRLALIGVAIGVVGALATSRVLASMLFGVTTYDPLVFGAIAMLLVSVALVATFLPARRATKVDPVVALRYQ